MLKAKGNIKWCIFHTKSFGYCLPQHFLYSDRNQWEKKRKKLPLKRKCAILSEMWFSCKWTGVWMAQQAPKSMAQLESKIERRQSKKRSRSVSSLVLSYRLLHFQLNLLVRFRNLHQDHPCRQKSQLSTAGKIICSTLQITYRKTSLDHYIFHPTIKLNISYINRMFIKTWIKPLFNA